MEIVQPTKINRTPLYLSLSSCGGISTEEALETCAATGIHHVELAIGVKRDGNVSAALEKWQASRDAVSRSPCLRLGHPSPL